ncbi:MAG: 1-deoxy-D-xylulose-5-phosphate reductoisomerase [Gammaproteobacteria bacterium]|nr:1-deoxy-D-xylulose-5-phosphate reductoisomerase [Gammaproteobacteria bacterium]MCY4357637.1 1-deoxy-D-xylulose-5-phosphate reductoisomerase [Gammaproteobacteria bacterium]
MTDSRKLTILGSTGSVGTSTLQVVKEAEDIEVFALTAHTNRGRLLEQCQQFRPRFAVLVEPDAAGDLAQALQQTAPNTELLTGTEALCRVASHSDVDMIMAAIVGGAGLESSLAAVEAGKHLLLANKESLVMSGSLFMETAQSHGATLLPIDSEHNAVFQCLPTALQQHIGDRSHADIEKITLTASGGPFLDLPLAEQTGVTPAQACKHPRWSMGRKISVDSATMMNKGLELIEASLLFNLPPEKIDVVIHPQSIIHSMVHYLDGSVLAQMANPDMRVPITHGLAWPQRMPSGTTALDLAEIGRLDFREPDTERFPCLRLGREAAQQGGTAPVILNAANEVAVAAFLEGRLGFVEIAQVIEQALAEIPSEAAPRLESILEIDGAARKLARELVGNR